MKKTYLLKPLKKTFAETLMLLCCQFLTAQSTVSVDWGKVISESKTTPTLQVVVNPMLLRNSPIHEGSFNALKNLKADYVRFVPWFPYPHMAVAELKPPTATETSWDFSHIDPIVEDLMNATKGHSVVINFSTIPAWMFKTEKPVVVPNDPNQVFWAYNEGKELRDPSLKELTDYYVRLMSWYTKGGFTDELGKFHKSDHNYKIPYWEVLNEPDLEHNTTPQSYTKMYDAIVLALKEVSPDTKFIGLSLAFETNPEWFEYFLNPANHKPGVTLEGISYHFYGTPDNNKQSINTYQYSFFNQANGFLDRVRYIESIRKRLSPQVFTTINEIGNILSRDGTNEQIPNTYWNLSGAMYAYIYLELTKMGVDAAGESQLVGYPTQFPSVSMMNWKNGKPNSRFWVLKLLRDNFGSGDQLVATHSNIPGVVTQGFITKKGSKLLLINKDLQDVQFQLPKDAKAVSISYVDPSTGENPPATQKLTGNTVKLSGFSVAVIDFDK
ncbi:MAG: glycosyl hydrolase family 39 [Bacteroidota bacterium]|nr:glycosyl hydrolase family 39 [Bacteroidota bacterium]